MSFVQIDPSQTELLQKNLFELTRLLKEVPDNDEDRNNFDDLSAPTFLKAPRFARKKRSVSKPRKETKQKEVVLQNKVSDEIDLPLLARKIEKRELFDKPPITQPPSSGSRSRELDLDEILELSEDVQSELIQGKVNQDQLAKLNKKLENLKINYGNVAGIAVATAAVISGLTDLLDLISKLSGQ